MMFNISRTYEISPEAATYLQRSIDNDPICVETLESVAEAVVTGQGQLYSVSSFNELYGIFLVSMVPRANQKDLLNVVLLGGDKIMEWKDALWNFILSMMEDSNSDLAFISRKGWEKVFPELQVVGSAYYYMQS